MSIWTTQRVAGYVKTDDSVKYLYRKHNPVSFQSPTTAKGQDIVSYKRISLFSKENKESTKPKGEINSNVLFAIIVHPKIKVLYGF